MPTTGVPCSNTAKTRNPLKLAGVPQTTAPISATSGRSSPYCGDIWRRYLLLNKFFFPIVDTCLSCEDMARQSCMMLRRWRIFGYFLRTVFSASHVQHHVSGLHPKFAVRPHHVWKYGRHSICDGCNFHFKIHAFSPNHSHFFKHTHDTILSYDTVSL